MPNYIEEYLVKLGFSTDVAGYDKFKKALGDASSIVTNNTSGMIRKVAEFETAAIAGFAAVSAAVINMADKSAMADQSYRLFALHMYTSVPVARQLKIGIDAIGASLEDIMNDPELAHRFDMFVKLQQRIALPQDFEKNMVKIRDLRQSFVNLYEFIDKYLIPEFSNALVRIFGKDMDEMQAKVEEWTNYLIDHMPEISDWFANTLAPVLVTAKELFLSLWEDAKAFMQLYTQLIGMLSGESDLTKATTDWKDFAKAVQMTAIFIGGVATDIAKIVGNVVRLVQAALALQTMVSATDMSGHLISWEERKKAAADMMAAFQKMQLPELGQDVPLPTDTGETKAARAAREQVLRSMGIGGKGAATPEGFYAGAGGGVAASASDPKLVQQMIVAQARAMGIDPTLALAVAQQESHFHQLGAGGGILTSETGAQGVMQVLPSTTGLVNAQLKKAGKQQLDPSNVAQNIDLGLYVLRERLAATGGNVELALRQYKQGTGRKDYMKDEAGNYAREVMARQSGITIDTININVPGGDPAKVKPAVLDALNQAEKLRKQRQLAEFANPQWHTSAVGAG